MRKIHFKRADMLRRLGITHLSGKNQQLLEQRMHRLSGVDMLVKNAYFQTDGTLVTSVGLKLIEFVCFALHRTLSLGLHGEWRQIPRASLRNILTEDVMLFEEPPPEMT
jgi:hypothetical protein